MTQRKGSVILTCKRCKTEFSIWCSEASKRDVHFCSVPCMNNPQSPSAVTLPKAPWDNDK